LFLRELAPQFERVTGNKVTISHDEAGVVRKRILGGEAFDVTFLPVGWEEIRKTLASDPVAIGHSDLGMAVLSTAPSPTPARIRQQSECCWPSSRLFTPIQRRARPTVQLFAPALCQPEAQSSIQKSV
jgi:hypothetical protein